MIIEEAKDSFIFKKKVEWTNQDGTEDYVELREFNMQEQLQFQEGARKDGKADEVAAIKIAEKLFKECVVGSSIAHSDGTPATKEEVYNILKKNSSLFLDIIATWLGQDGTESPFYSMSKKNKK